MSVIALETYRPSPKQQVFHQDEAKYRLLLGAWRAGKSIAMIWELICWALEYPGVKLILFRKTYPALRDTTWKDFLTECPPELLKDVKRTEGREEATFINGSVLMARCLDDWRKTGSASFGGVAFDEGYEFTEDDFDMVAMGRLSGKIGPRRFIIATNPPNRDHWLFKKFEGTLGNAKLVDSSVHHFATTDNYTICDAKHPEECGREPMWVLPNGDRVPEDTPCHHNLPPGYIDSLQRMSENKRRRFVEGLWGFTAEGTPIFQEFSETRHVAALRTEPGVPVIRGWDFGYRHPACVWVQCLPTGHVHVLHELLGADEDIESFSRRVQSETARLFPGYQIVDYCDAAGVAKNDLGLTSIRVLQKHGIRPRFRKLRIWKTIEAIRELIERTSLGVPRFRVNSTCTWTIEAFAGGYVVRTKPDGEEEPLKDGTYDHIVDAVRYALAEYFFPATRQTAGPYRRYGLSRRQRVAV